MESIKGLKVEKKDINHKTIISVGKEEIGGTRLAIIAGPCSVEDKDQIMNDAKLVKSCGANFLRGGIFKPRTKKIRDDAHGSTSWVSITIREGKFRQVRKMTAAVGFPTLRLIRVRIGNILLNTLAAGEVIEVNILEID